MLPDGTATSTDQNTLSVFYPNVLSSGSLKVKGVNNCGSGPESTLQVSVNNLPQPPVISLVNGVLASSEYSGNQWFLENTPVRNAVTQNFTPTEGGKYHAVVTVNNCSSLPSNIISVTTGITGTPETEGIKIYPNPTTGIIEISIGRQPRSDFRVEVFNNSGEMVYSALKPMEETLFRIDLGQYPPGLYIIRITGGDIFYVGKIVRN